MNTHDYTLLSLATAHFKWFGDKKCPLSGFPGVFNINWRGAGAASLVALCKHIGPRSTGARIHARG